MTVLVFLGALVITRTMRCVTEPPTVVTIGEEDTAALVTVVPDRRITFAAVPGFKLTVEGPAEKTISQNSRKRQRFQLPSVWELEALTADEMSLPELRCEDSFSFGVEGDLHAEKYHKLVSEAPRTS